MLKKMMNGLINKAQNAFVEGRQIIDASLLANEIIDSMMKWKEKGILCKLDIENAYDQINWNCIIKVLQKIGFRVKWVSWIKWCISTASFSVMINGSLARFFNSSRGLEQGHYLSPYLFVIGMEVFSILVDKAATGGFLSGYNMVNIHGENMQITHFYLADDTLVFCSDTRDQMAYLSWILLWFEATSGLRINLEKSSIILVGNVENIEDLAHELGCRIVMLPSTYLGLPLGMRLNSLQVWDGVEERFRKRLALWKRQYIFKGGRLTLIKSTRTNMPIYTMSPFWIPKGVKSKLEKIQRDFLWGGGNLDITQLKLAIGFWKEVFLAPYRQASFGTTVFPPK